MKTKEFTLIQLFSILDGRLSTTIDDVYEMLNHIFDENFMTHHLPTAMKFLKEQARPDWFVMLDDQLQAIKVMHGNEFTELTAAIRTHFNEHKFAIPQLTPEQKQGFEDYMINNSLLIKKVRSQNNLPGVVRNIIWVILLGVLCFIAASCSVAPAQSQDNSSGVSVHRIATSHETSYDTRLYKVIVDDCIYIMATVKYDSNVALTHAGNCSNPIHNEAK